LTSFVNLGYNSTTDKMYATSSGTDSFYSIDRATGVATLIASLGGPTNPDSGIMYMADNNTDNLYPVNMTTGVATIIGSMGAGNILGLVWVPDTVVACYAGCD